MATVQGLLPDISAKIGILVETKKISIPVKPNKVNVEGAHMCMLVALLTHFPDNQELQKFASANKKGPFSYQQIIHACPSICIQLVPSYTWSKLEPDKYIQHTKRGQGQRYDHCTAIGVHRYGVVVYKSPLNFLDRNANQKNLQSG